MNVSRVYSQIKENMKEFINVNISLQTHFRTLQSEHPMICRDRFNFNRTEWMSYSKRIFTRISEEVERQGITVENRKFKLL